MMRSSRRSNHREVMDSGISEQPSEASIHSLSDLRQQLARIEMKTAKDLKHHFIANVG